MLHFASNEAPGTAGGPAGQRTAERCAARQLLQDEQQWLCLGCVTGYAQRAAQALGVEDVWFNSYINHY